MAALFCRNGLISVVSGIMMAFSLTVLSAEAKDPFRTKNPRPISETTEAAFRAIFEKGNYPDAEKRLRSAPANEVPDPLNHALKASFAFLNDDSPAFKRESTQTRMVAERLIKTDPLRGNLYTAVGHFLEGAYQYSQEQLSSLPAVLGKLQDVYKYMEAAEAIDSSDPELSLIKGYVDLLMATSLPFSDPNQAISLLESSAAPRYLAYRGIAIAYRDMRKQDQALVAVDQALRQTPDNPEVIYLKAQILVKQKKLKEALPLFAQALTKKSQLPGGVVKSLQREHDRTVRQLAKISKAGTVQPRS
jgi:tetratricopeptide (TPR) repeat protein